MHFGLQIKNTPIFMDVKLLFVPLLFLLLRVWNFVLDCLLFYTKDDVAEDFKESVGIAFLIMMSVSLLSKCL